MAITLAYCTDDPWFETHLASGDSKVPAHCSPSNQWRSGGYNRENHRWDTVILISACMMLSVMFNSSDLISFSGWWQVLCWRYSSKFFQTMSLFLNIYKIMTSRYKASGLARPQSHLVMSWCFICSTIRQCLDWWVPNI